MVKLDIRSSGRWVCFRKYGKGKFILRTSFSKVSRHQSIALHLHAVDSTFDVCRRRFARVKDPSPVVLELAESGVSFRDILRLQRNCSLDRYGEVHIDRGAQVTVLLSPSVRLRSALFHRKTYSTYIAKFCKTDRNWKTERLGKSVMSEITIQNDGDSPPVEAYTQWSAWIKIHTASSILTKKACRRQYSHQGRIFTTHSTKFFLSSNKSTSCNDLRLKDSSARTYQYMPSGHLIVWQHLASGDMPQILVTYSYCHPDFPPSTGIIWILPVRQNHQTLHNANV
jgi:hypothetical protein